LPALGEGEQKVTFIVRLKTVRLKTVRLKTVRLKTAQLKHDGQTLASKPLTVHP
jgi:hypothetical protein